MINISSENTTDINELDENEIATWSDLAYQSNATGDSIDGGTTAFVDGQNADGGDFITQNRYHHICWMPTNPTIATDDVVITGIRVTDFTEQANTVLYGTEGYVIEIKNNPLIQSLADAQMVANTVGAKIVGMKFRPMSLSTRSNPSIEAGDVGYVSTRKGTYQTVFTNVVFSVGKPMKITCDAESPARNSAVRYDAATKAIVEARKMVNTEKTAREQAISNLANELANASGLYMTKEEQPDHSFIYYMHNKPALAESMVIWKLTADAFGISTDGGLTYPYGLDVNGDAILNRIYAIGLDATYIKAGKIMSTDGKTLIDLAYGVANEDNVGETDNVQDGFPLSLSFNIGDSVSKIDKVLLQYTQKKFRTYSTGTYSGGGDYASSSSGGGYSGQTGDNAQQTQVAMHTSYEGTTGMTSSHSHSYSLINGSHETYNPTHNHSMYLPDHSHTIYIPSHSHNLNFGIQETPVTSNAIDIYVDGTLRKSIDAAQGIEDLTQWITTPGWHTVELRSTTLKRISAQVKIKSYITM